MNRRTYDLNAREMIWWQTKGHIPAKLLNGAMRVGTAVLLTVPFPPTLRARFCLHCSCSCLRERFGWCACLQPLKGACSRGGFQHRLPPIPPYGLLMCGVIQKPMSSTYIHTWLVILEYAISCPQSNALLCLTSTWLGKISQHHEIWRFVCKYLNYLVSGVLERMLTCERRKQLVFNVDLYFVPDGYGRWNK